MNRNETRWAQIVFWEMGELLRLHTIEEKLEKKCEELIAKRESPIETWGISYMSEMEDRAALVPYWDRCLKEGDRKVRMDSFVKAIYPIWKPIMGQNANDFADMSALHKADLAIYRRSVRPNRGNVGRPSDNRLEEVHRDGND